MLMGIYMKVIEKMIKKMMKEPSLMLKEKSLQESGVITKCMLKA
jgi:hypothetical protein